MKDIWKGSYRGETVCLKVLRIHIHGDQRKRAKVADVRFLLFGTLRPVQTSTFFLVGISQRGIGVDSSQPFQFTPPHWCQHCPLPGGFLLSLALDGQRRYHSIPRATSTS